MAMYFSSASCCARADRSRENSIRTATRNDLIRTECHRIFFWQLPRSADSGGVWGPGKPGVRCFPNYFAVRWRHGRFNGAGGQQSAALATRRKAPSWQETGDESPINWIPFGSVKANHNNFGAVWIGRARRSARAVVAQTKRRARSDAPHLAASKLNASRSL